MVLGAGIVEQDAVAIDNESGGGGVWG
jgi:hypothetical protein